MQAEYFREFLDGQRMELTTDLAAHTRRLTESMTAVGGSTTVSDVRRTIRGLERELRVIDRMVEALNGRPSRSGEVTGRGVRSLR